MVGQRQRIAARKDEFVFPLRPSQKRRHGPKKRAIAVVSEGVKAVGRRVEKFSDNPAPPAHPFPDAPRQDGNAAMFRHALDEFAEGNLSIFEFRPASQCEQLDIFRADHLASRNDIQPLPFPISNNEASGFPGGQKPP
ncbi:MAG: hypothetical protein ACLFRG_08965 [Desulfococcaceae bacterium]